VVGGGFVIFCFLFRCFLCFLGGGGGGAWGGVSFVLSPHFVFLGVFFFIFVCLFLVFFV